MLFVHVAMVWGQVAHGQVTDTSAEALVQVWHEPPRTSGASQWLPQPILHTAGEVIELTDQRLQLRTTAPGSSGSDEEEVVNISPHHVVWIEPPWSDDAARQGMEHFQAGRYAEAIPLLLKAIQAGPPVWQQQWLTAHLAMAAAEAERYPAALELVAQLARSRAPLPTLALLPIDWTGRPANASAVAAARQRIGAAEPAVQLVAASWMLGSAADRAAAEQVLQTLSTSTGEPWVARLAEAVRWRRTAVPQIEQASQSWLEKIDQMPIVLQGGPLLCVADRLTAAGLAERGRELHLAVALLHQRPRPIADRARAALALTQE